MPSIGDVGDELRRAVEQIEEAAASAGRAEHDVTEALAGVNAATESSLSYVAEEGRSLWQQALERLAEALALFKGGQDTMTAYIASITASGDTSWTTGTTPTPKARVRDYPDGSRRTPGGKYAGNDGAGRSGLPAERQAMTELEDDGYETDVRQQTTKTPVDIEAVKYAGTRLEERFTIPAGTIRRYDGAAKYPDHWRAIEVKGGTARRTPTQRAIDEWLNRPGNTLVTPEGRVFHRVAMIQVAYSHEEGAQHD